MCLDMVKGKLGPVLFNHKGIANLSAEKPLEVDDLTRKILNNPLAYLERFILSRKRLWTGKADII